MRLVLLSLAGYEVRGLHTLAIYKHLSNISIYILASGNSELSGQRNAVKSEGADDGWFDTRMTKLSHVCNEYLNVIFTGLGKIMER